MADVPDHERKRRERLARLPRVTAKYLRGRSVRDIAQLEGVTPRVIYKDIEIACKTWLRAVRSNAEAIIAQELARLAEVERAAWLQYENSQKPYREVTITEDTGTGSIGDDGADEDFAPRRTKKRTKKQMLGDTKCLDIVLKCVAMRCKLLRVDGQNDELDEADMLQAKIVEVVVSTPEEVGKIIQYAKYDEGIQAAEAEAESTEAPAP